MFPHADSIVASYEITPSNPVSIFESLDLKFIIFVKGSRDYSKVVDKFLNSFIYLIYSFLNK